MKRIEGKLEAKGFRFGLVASRFNNFFTDKLVEGALDCLIRHGADDKQITIVHVPGSFEIPFAASRMVKSGNYDAVLCVGAVIRGDTPHFDYIAAEASKGIARLGMEANIPVVYGIITADNLEQAIERSGTKAGNKGWDAAMTAIEMVNLYRVLG
ncbi:MAG: 6,7-dimethyl-8-ribityllumazine synthase [Candidatus Zixiibacteriota bacterium]